MGRARGRGSRPSEPRAGGLAVGVHPRPLPGAPASGPAPAADPSPGDALPRAPAGSPRPLGGEAATFWGDSSRFAARRLGPLDVPRTPARLGRSLSSQFPVEEGKLVLRRVSGPEGARNSSVPRETGGNGALRSRKSLKYKDSTVIISKDIKMGAGGTVRDSKFATKSREVY